MSWFPVDDAFHSHPKAQKAGDEAIGMWTRAGSHCMAYLTDGFVAEWWVKQQPKGMAKAQRLLDAGLWRQGENAEGEPGFWFHDWKAECTKSHILAARENARQRKAKSRESRGESQGESRVTGRVTERVSPPSCLDPTQPNPTQPIKENSGCEPTELTLGSATNPARGARLPDDWRPTDDAVTEMHQRFPAVDLKTEHEKFTNYWRSTAGAKGRKSDWEATWRNWIIRSAEQLPPRNGTNGQPHKMRTALELAAELRAEEQAQLETASHRRAIQ